MQTQEKDKFIYLIRKALSIYLLKNLDIVKKDGTLFGIFKNTSFSKAESSDISAALALKSHQITEALSSKILSDIKLYGGIDKLIDDDDNGDAYIRRLSNISTEDSV